VREPLKRRRFEALSFRNAVRRLQSGRRRPADAEEAPADATAPAAEAGTGAA
jgi:hypothetical protein